MQILVTIAWGGAHWLECPAASSNHSKRFQIKLFEQWLSVYICQRGCKSRRLRDAFILLCRGVDAILDSCQHDISTCVCIGCVGLRGTMWRACFKALPGQAHDSRISSSCWIQASWCEGGPGRHHGPVRVFPRELCYRRNLHCASARWSRHHRCHSITCSKLLSI